LDVTIDNAPSRQCVAADPRRRLNAADPVRASADYRTGYRDGAQSVIAEGDENS
jgi:hypothetical protein